MGAGSLICCGRGCCEWLDKDEKVIMVKTNVTAPNLRMTLQLCNLSDVLYCLSSSVIDSVT